VTFYTLPAAGAAKICGRVVEVLGTAKWLLVNRKLIVRSLHHLCSVRIALHSVL